EPEPAPKGDLTDGTPPARLAELEAAVDGDGVVQRLDEREAVPVEAEDAVAEGLVVVHDVEVRPSGPQDPAHAQAVGQWLREPGRAHDGQLEHIDGRAELAGDTDV